MKGEVMMEVKSDVPPWEPIEKESFASFDTHTSVVDRYFLTRYAVNVRQPGDDYRVLIHSNRTCVVTMAPSHELLSKEKSIESVQFQVTDKRNTLETKISGKRKHGALRLQPATGLFIVKCPSAEYKLCAGISGKLLEVNQNLVESPNLLVTDSQLRGFLAIVLPDPYTAEKYKKELLTHDQYEEMVKARSQEMMEF